MMPMKATQVTTDQNMIPLIGVSAKPATATPKVTVIHASATASVRPEKQ